MATATTRGALYDILLTLRRYYNKYQARGLDPDEWGDIVYGVIPAHDQRLILGGYIAGLKIEQDGHPNVRPTYYRIIDLIAAIELKLEDMRSHGRWSLP